MIINPQASPYNAVGDGVADDTSALQAALNAAFGNGGVVDGNGATYRTTSDLSIQAGVGAPVFDKGLTFRNCTLVADYNGNITTGAIIRCDTAAISNYVTHLTFEGLKLKQASGRTGLNGIQLTAAWNVDIEHCEFENLSGSGIVTTLRTDIHPTISDYYQSFTVNVENCRIGGCQGWGIKFGAGQSPGLYRIKHNIIVSNVTGGIYTTTGQCEIVSNLVVANGTYGGQGGLWFDTAEGPQFNALVMLNEFDTNQNYHIKHGRSRNHRVTLNRFLSSTYADTVSLTPVSGGSVMRPPVHVIMGSEIQECWNCSYEQNYHRSVNLPNQTTATCIGYLGASQAQNNRIYFNDYSYADGYTQNSSGFVATSNLPSSNLVLAPGSAPPGGSPPPDPDVVFYGRITTSGQDVYSVDTHLNFPTHDTNVGPCYTAYNFTAPETRSYEFSANIRFQNMVSGNTVQWGTRVNTGSYNYLSAISASGSTSQDFVMPPTTLSLTAGDTVKIAMKTGAGTPSRQMNTSDPTKIWLKIRKV